MIPLARELGIGLVPWSPMGAGMLTAVWKSRDDIPDGDVRKTMHNKFSEENFDKVCARAERRPSALMVMMHLLLMLVRPCSSVHRGVDVYRLTSPVSCVKLSGDEHWRAASLAFTGGTYIHRLQPPTALLLSTAMPWSHTSPRDRSSACFAV